MPREALPHTVEINYGSVAAAQSPYRVYVRQPPDLSKLIISGNWFETDVTLHKPMNFTVDARNCGDGGNGDGALEVHVIHHNSKTEIPVKLINNNNVYYVEMTPLRPGKYITNLIYGGFTVPFDKVVFANTTIDISRITVQEVKTSESSIRLTSWMLNIENKQAEHYEYLLIYPISCLFIIILDIGTGFPTEFLIDLSKAGSELDYKHIQVLVTDQNGGSVPVSIDPTKDAGVSKITYTPLVVGLHTIEMAYENKPIPSSPYVVQTVMPCDPKLVKAIGPGLEGGTIGEICKFVVDTKSAGSGGLTLAIEGPSETSLKYMDDKNGSCFVEYVPTEPGEYEISIIFGQSHIPGSPFKVAVSEAIDPNKVRVFGPAVDGTPVKVGVPTHFIVDVALAGPGLVGVTLNNMQGIPVENVKVENNGDGLYSVHFVPPVEGLLMAYVKFAHQDVPSRCVTRIAKHRATCKAF